MVWAGKTPSSSWSEPPASPSTEIVSEPCFPRSALSTDTLKGRTGPGSLSPGSGWAFSGTGGVLGFALLTGE